MIAQGVTLTINPGVTVQFNENQTLIVEGAIVADGDAGSEITFTSSANKPAKGDWGTIRFNSTTGVGSLFDHVIIEYGGAPNSEGNTGAMISYRTGAYAFDLTNKTVRNSWGMESICEHQAHLLMVLSLATTMGMGYSQTWVLVMKLTTRSFAPFDCRI